MVMGVDMKSVATPWPRNNHSEKGLIHHEVGPRFSFDILHLYAETVQYEELHGGSPAGSYKPSNGRQSKGFETETN